MRITWLGQAGLLLRTDKLTVLIDPYFSDSVGQRDPEKHRRIPVLPELWNIRPDVLIFTHDHLDHFDPDIADAVFYFAAHARNTTGAELTVDGGNTIQLYPIIPNPEV